MSVDSQNIRRTLLCNEANSACKNNVSNTSHAIDAIDCGIWKIAQSGLNKEMLDTDEVKSAKQKETETNIDGARDRLLSEDIHSSDQLGYKTFSVSFYVLSPFGNVFVPICSVYLSILNNLIEVDGFVL